ncbi:hypothetical protein [Pseudomonas sp. SWRI99]|uniref:hypothetical protein n=1 Tax=Pseudomonas sp. SWRI99 TaxID=2745506 RepID=UPI00164647CB|nr:hypothetical protein [Pseudomonas sp. SWRI99]MBC3778173.1 hypothetical protein [Pseudomonas sp. SWRI99]
MLMHPYLNIPYCPRLDHFLGGFDIYDREESLGEELALYDPEYSPDRKILIARYVVKRFSKLSYRHKFVLVGVLKKALDGDGDILAQILQHDPFSHSVLPDGWDEMKSPKAFFEEMYVILSDEWSNELNEAGAEDFSTW